MKKKKTKAPEIGPDYVPTTAERHYVRVAAMIIRKARAVHPDNPLQAVLDEIRSDDAVRWEYCRDYFHASNSIDLKTMEGIFRYAAYRERTDMRALDPLNTWRPTGRGQTWGGVPVAGNFLDEMDRMHGIEPV